MSHPPPGTSGFSPPLLDELRLSLVLAGSSAARGLVLVMGNAQHAVTCAEGNNSLVAEHQEKIEQDFRCRASIL